MQHGVLNAEVLNQYLLKLAQSEVKKEIKEPRIEIDKKAMESALAQINQLRKSSEPLDNLHKVLELMVNREPAITAEMKRDLEQSLNVPLIDCSNQEGRTPLMHAAAIGSVGFVKALLQFGANPHLRDKKNKTALHFAVEKIGNSVVPLLLEANVPLDVLDSEGYTPLMRVVLKSDIATLQLLLNSGADVNIINQHKMTALKVAIDKGFFAAAELLLNYGAKVTNLYMELLFDFKNIVNSYQLTDLTKRIQIAVHILDQRYIFPQVSDFSTILRGLENSIDESAKSAWCFCMAETIRRQGYKNETEKAEMLSLYQQACDKTPFVFAAAKQLGIFAAEQNSHLEAISYFIQAIVGNKQQGLLEFLKTICPATAKVNIATNAEQKQEFHLNPILEGLCNDPCIWQALIQQFYKLEQLPEEKILAGQSGSIPRLTAIVHDLFIQIPLSVLNSSLFDLSMDELDYLIMIISGKADQFKQPEDCAHLLMHVVQKRYQTIPVALKDQLINMHQVLQKIDDVFITSASESALSTKVHESKLNEVKLSQSNTASLDDGDFELKKPTTALCDKEKDQLLDEGFKLFLQYMGKSQKLWKTMLEKIPLHVRAMEEKSVTKLETKLENVADVNQEQAFLSLFRLIPQKERAQCLKNFLFKYFKYTYAKINANEKLPEDFSAEPYQKLLQQLPLTARENYRAKAKERYLLFYIELLVLKSENKQDPSLVSVKKAVLAKTPKDLQGFMKLIDPSGDQAAVTSPQSATSLSPELILSTRLPNKILSKFIFLLVKSRLIGKKESPEDQRNLILPFIPPKEMLEQPAFLTACSHHLPISVRKQFQFELSGFINVDGLDDDGQTLLMHAATNGAVGFAQVLLEAQADPNLKDKQGQSALGFSLLQPENPVTSLLLESGASPNDADPEGYTPLMIAVFNKDYKTAKLLLEKKAEVNSQDKKGNTALHYATETGQVEIVKLLLNYKADVNLVNKQGSSPLKIAIQKDFCNICEILLAAKADLSCGEGSLLCVVFQQESKNDSTMIVNYPEQEFDVTSFINNCKSLNQKIRIAAFLLNYNVQVLHPDKLLSLIKSLESKLLNDMKYFWHFCMAEILRKINLENAGQPVPPDTGETIAEHYKKSAPFPYLECRKGLFALLNKEYQKAFYHLSHANVGNDPLSRFVFIKLGYALTTIKIDDKVSGAELNSASLESLSEQIEKRVLKFTFKEIASWKQKLTIREWAYLATIMRNQLQKGVKVDVWLMFYATQKIYSSLSFSPKDALENLIQIRDELAKGIPPITKEKNIDFEKYISLIYELLPWEKQAVLKDQWEKLKKEAVSKPLETKRSLPPVSKSEADENFQKKVAFVKRAVLATFIILCVQVDKTFYEKSRELFGAILKDYQNQDSLTQWDKATSHRLRKFIQLFELSEREKCRPFIREIIQLVQRENLSDQNYAQLIEQFHELFDFAKQGFSSGKEEKNMPFTDKKFEDVLISIFEEFGVSRLLNFVVDIHENTLIIRAILQDDVKRLKHLLRLNLYLDGKNCKYETAVYIAVNLEKNNILKLLLDAKAFPGSAGRPDLVSPVILAAQKGNMTALKLLLAAGANSSWKDSEDCTALIHATKNGHLGCVKLLIQEKADVNLSDTSGKSALVYAARLKHYEIARELIFSGKARVSEQKFQLLKELFKREVILEPERFLDPRTGQTVSFGKPSSKIVTYSDLEYSVEKFSLHLNESKEIGTIIKCAALFISVGALIKSQKSLVKVLNNLSDNVKTMPEWSYCMAKALWEKCKIHKDRSAKSWAQIQKLYEQCENTSLPVFRAKGELLFGQDKYDDAAKLFIRANANGDVLAMGWIIKTAEKMQDFKTKKSKAFAMLPQLETVLLNISLEQIHLFQALKVLDKQGWNYLVWFVKNNVDKFDKMQSVHLVHFATLQIKELVLDDRYYDSHLAEHFRFCRNITIKNRENLPFYLKFFNKEFEDALSRISANSNPKIRLSDSAPDPAQVVVDYLDDGLTPDELYRIEQRYGL